MWNANTLRNADEFRRCRVVIALCEAGFGANTVADLAGLHYNTVWSARRAMKTPDKHSVYRETHNAMKADGMQGWIRRLVINDVDLMAKIKALHPNARIGVIDAVLDVIHGL